MFARSAFFRAFHLGDPVCLCVYLMILMTKVPADPILSVYSLGEARHLFLFLKKVPFLSAIFFLSEYTVIIRWDGFG